MRPLILITNDDSIAARGIKHLIDCVKDMGYVIVVAPDAPQSGMSSAISVNKPLRITPHSDVHGARVFSVSGTPVDCIKLALHSIVPRRPDLVLSGINHGTNSGTAVTYSGTMGAVLEGCMAGIPSIGYSLLDIMPDANFDLSAQCIVDITRKVLNDGLPAYTCLNVNIPALVVPKGIRVCRAARGHWTEEYVRYTDPFGAPFFWLTGRFINSEPDATDTDEYWLANKYVSVVPVTPDQTITADIPAFAKRFDE